MGDHTEVVSIDYDPTVVNYSDLLAEFWLGHRCDSINRSTQYRKAVFYRDETQRQLALGSREEHSEREGLSLDQIRTGILPANHFTYAEAYHQKYSLSRASESRLFLESVYPTGKALADSTVATRLNAYLGAGLRLDWKALQRDLGAYGLPAHLEKQIRQLIASRSSRE